jgi:hypothetical protein
VITPAAGSKAAVFGNNQERVMTAPTAAISFRHPLLRLVAAAAPHADMRAAFVDKPSFAS